MEPVTVVHLAPRIEDHMGRPRTGEQTRADINNNPTGKERAKALAMTLPSSHYLTLWMQQKCMVFVRRTGCSVELDLYSPASPVGR